MNRLTATERAYLAGILDGEGHVTVQRGYGKRNRHHVYAVVKVSNTDPLLIEWLRVKTGVGAVSRRAGARAHYQAVSTIVWVSNDALDVLRAARGWLQVKRGRADLVLSLDRLNRAASLEAGGPFGNGRPVPAWLREQRSNVISLLRVHRRAG